MFKTPPKFKTALRFILYDKSKSIGALFGVIISTFLIGQQTGVFSFLTNSMNVLVGLNSQYIWVVDNHTENANALGRLDNRIEYELKSLKGIKNVHPLFVGGATVQFPQGDNTAVTLIGVSSPDFVGGPAQFYEGKARNLLPDGAIAVDIFDTRVFPKTDLGTTLEINGRKAYIAARTKGVRGFGGVLVFTTIERARLWSAAGDNTASAFLVETSPGQDRQQMIGVINKNIYGVRAWEGKELGNKTIQFILKNTSIATSIGTMVVFAFIAGFFIVGLTLFSAAVDRVKDYGTMKAIGATNGYIRRLIYTQAAIFAILGFSIGFLLIKGFTTAIAKQGLLIHFSPSFLIVFFMLICFIALGGATFASRRISKFEPAEVFRF
ncbi:MAG: ABC transporter permease [Saprospiraceae bacterium]|nr:ABC transporter permease [Saprospiraceae bacterium]MCB9323835.1 ABC transporter permease [Lewinellaceae bacterium]